MIHITEKEKCSGCSACSAVCPKQCIQLFEDEEGFQYPKINTELCIDCGRCNQICPIENVQENERKSISVLGAVNKNKEVQKKSSSGGVFYSLARNVLKKGGVVFGALYDENLEVVHSFIEKESDIVKMQGSKYVQSDMQSSFVQVKEFLKKNRLVLFSGTPCQVKGLLNFLGKEYDNLITVDFICTGVPSPKILRAYKEKILDKNGRKAQNIEFRNKKDGWISFSMLFDFGKDKKYISRYESGYINGQYSHITLRPACYSCEFKKLNSRSDIKLSDFWLVKQAHPEFYDYHGVSHVMINSEKGMSLFNEVKEEFDICESSYEEVEKYNHAFTVKSPLNKKRETFFAEIADENVTPEKIVSLLDNITKKPWKERLRCKLFILKNKIF